MKNRDEEWTIRAGRPDDIKAIHGLIMDLAIYERAESEFVVSIEELTQDGFGPDAIYELIVAESGGEVVGMALWYVKYSTWKGKCGYLEDLMVADDYRKLGVGKALFEAVARESAKRGYLRLEWQVLDWNENAIGFYNRLGAELDGEWFNGKLTGEALSSYKSMQ
jgi:GNAT superfamily N-acetyltransferase